MRTVLDRFNEYWVPVPESGCWLWLGASKKEGRGTFSIANRTWCAARVSYALHKGGVPDELYVCHKCDTPSCVNPDHLFLGTAIDNTRDAIRKGRLAQLPSRQPALTEAQKKEIRANPEGLTNAKLAEKYGVASGTIYYAKYPEKAYRPKRSKIMEAR